MADDYFRTVSLPLPSTGRFARSHSLGLRLLPDWTVLADSAGQPLPPQQWAAPVEAAVDEAMVIAEGWIEDAGEREQLVLRMLAAARPRPRGTLSPGPFRSPSSRSSP